MEGMVLGKASFFVVWSLTGLAKVILNEALLVNAAQCVTHDRK